MSNELRKRLRAYYQECDRISAEWAARDYSYPPPRYPTMPPELASLRCGAKTRAGTPCKRKDIFENGRCKLHGGLSTGPTSDEGKDRCKMNARKRSP